MSIFENNFALKPSNVLSSLDQLIQTLQSIDEITVYFKRIISGEIEIDLGEAKKSYPWQKQTKIINILVKLQTMF
jgi:hypothetical protein